jgi:hypothetical protein
LSNSAISINNISHFHNLHAGETALLVGNGINLKMTPPEWFDLPTIGMNTIHLYEGWKPTYYTAVDSRVMREFGEAIADKYANIPKFVPTPNLDRWEGENFYRFYHRPGPYWTKELARKWTPQTLTRDGITYACIMHVAMQLAFFMGFTEIVMVGVQHKPAKAQDHFWGCDHGMTAYTPLEDWFAGYKMLVDGFAEQGVTVLNISEDTYVPESVIPRGDWRQYVKES